MELLQTISGGAPFIKKFQASVAYASTTAAGVLALGVVDSSTDVGEVTIPADASTPVVPGSMVGLSLDSPTTTPAATGQIATANMLVSVVVNPDAVYRAKMSFGTASDTALTIYTTTNASTSGVTTPGVTSIDNGVIWGYQGSNVGEYRIADDTSGGVSVSWPNDVATGDQYLCAAGKKNSAEASSPEFWDYTTTLDQLNVLTVVTDMDNLMAIDAELKDISDSGTTNSFWHVIQVNSAYSGAKHDGSMA
jgi:hypothetical protein